MNDPIYRVGESIIHEFATWKKDNTAPITFASGAVALYEDSAPTVAITTGVALTVDYNSTTGGHRVVVTATAANGYLANTGYTLRATAGTVDSVAVTGLPLWRFRLIAADQDGIVSRGTLAAGGSTTAFTLPAGQRANVQAGDFLKPTGIPGRFIAPGYNNSTGAGTVTTAFASDPSSTYYIVIGQAPQDTAAVPAANATQFAGQTITAAAGVTLPASVAATGAKMDLVDAPNATAVTAIQTSLGALVVETGLTLKNALRVALAIIAGEVTGGATATPVLKSVDLSGGVVQSTKDRVTGASVDSSGNRGKPTLDFS